MRFRTRAAIWIAKCVSKVIRLFGKGSGLTLPGRIASAISPDILSELSATIGKKVIAVMGTNGKTTTNSILYHVLTGEGHTAIINRTGSNMMNGIVSAFVLAADRKGRLNADYACVEVDENASRTVLPKLKPDLILLTNISRDQLDRFGEVDLTRETLKKAFSSVPDAVLAVNADDVISYTLARECPNRYVTSGISEQIFAGTARSEIMESIFCRECGEKLEYDFFHYGQLGVYHCPNCGFARETPAFTASEIHRQDGGYALKIGEKPVHLATESTYHIYNVLAVWTIIQTLNIPAEGFAELAGTFEFANGREEAFRIGGTKVQLNLAKNPIGFQQKVSLVLQDKEPKDIIILINDGFQDGRDISWLWDVDFQYLADANASRIFVTGTRRYDMALRLKYESIPCEVVPDMKEAVTCLCAEGTGNLHIIVNYTALYSTNAMLRSMQDNGIEKTGDAHPEPVRIPEAGMQQEGKTLTIGHLYPDLLNLYGDRGNIQCMRKRLEWRGIGSKVIRVLSGDHPDFSGMDIVLLGGGSDREQELVCRYLCEIRDELADYIRKGGVVLAVCGGYQLLGKYYRTPTEKIEGIGIMNHYTEWGSPRLVGDIVLDSPLCTMPVTGFENHGGRTYLNAETAFGKVISGFGNGDQKDYEGAVFQNVIASYLHGPLLPKNPEICDLLLGWALKNRYGGDYSFPDLPDETERKASQVIVSRAQKKK